MLQSELADKPPSRLADQPLMDWQIYIWMVWQTVTAWTGRSAPQLSGCVTLHRTGRQTREWTRRDLTPGRPAGRLSLWWTLENSFKKDFFRTENHKHSEGEKYSRKKPVSPTAFVHVLNFYVFCIWPQLLVFFNGLVEQKKWGECVGCDP